MKFGASIWPFRWDPPYGDALRRVAANGFRATELIGWNLDFLRDYYTPRTIADLRGILDGEGLELSQFVSTPHDLSSADPAARAAAVEHWRRAVEVGAGLGAEIINMVSAHAFGMKDGVEYPRITRKPLVQRYGADVPSGLDWDRNYADYVAALKQCADLCQAAGVKMSVEPHPGRYLANTDGALRLLEHVNSPVIGINLDPSHTFPVGDFPNVSVYRLGSKIIHCHVSDNDAVTNVHWRPGMGKIDWRAMLKALSEVGFDGVISVELEDVPGVSRGARMAAIAGFVQEDATQEFVDETVAGMRYLKRLCDELEIAYDE